MNCAKCGAENKDSNIFCVSCGAKLARKKVSSSNTENSPGIACPECGAKNEEEALCCSLCGNVLKNAEKENSGGNHASSSPIADRYSSRDEDHVTPKAQSSTPPALIIGIVVFALIIIGYATKGSFSNSIGSIPFKQPVSEIVKGALVNNTGKILNNIHIDRKKYVLVYFSAHWCPPCRMFTPQMAAFYKANKKKDNFEILFVSRDRSEMDMFNYMNQMPWLGVKYQSPAAEKLMGLAGPGIPCLVIAVSELNLSGIIPSIAVVPRTWSYREKSPVETYDNPACF